MIICGQEFNFSALNANDLDRMETAQAHMHLASDRETQRVRTNNVSMGDSLRGQCRLVMGYLDEVLGEGASERLGLDGNDLGACTRVVNAFKDAIISEQAEAKQITAVPMNHEQRRAAERAASQARVSVQAAVSRSEGFNPQVVSRPAQPAVTDEQKTNQLIDTRQAMNSLRDDPDAMQQLAEYALKLAAEHHV